MSQLERFQSDKKLATPQNRAWVQRYLNTGSNYPITLEIDATNKCPLDCPHCIWKDFREETTDSLQPNALLRVVREAKEIGVRSIHWTGGGDPLAHPTTLEAIQLATSLGIKNGMFTSAVQMTPRATEILLDNLSWVRIHVDGATRESYAQAHRVLGQVFDRVVGNLAYFTKRRAETGSQTSIGIGTVALEFNLIQAPGLARLSKQLGLDFFQYKHDLTQMQDPEYLEWWNRKVVPVMDELSMGLEGDGFTLQYSKGVNYTSPDLSPRCHVHNLSTAITADGRVAYCKSTRDIERWSLGNIYKQSLKEIFDSEAHKRLKERVTPTNCGILPCPYKNANQLIQTVLDINSIAPLDPVLEVEHQDFI